MQRLTITLALLALVTMSGCDRGERAPGRRRRRRRGPGTTGGSKAGDFGPPQGEPINAVLTSPRRRCRRHRQHYAGQGDRRARGDREGNADRRRREVHVLDLRRHGARQVHPRAPGRHGRVPPEEPSRQQDAAQHRPARASPARAAARRRASRRPATSRSSRSRRSTRASTSITARPRRSACTSPTACTA